MLHVEKRVNKMMEILQHYFMLFIFYSICGWIIEMLWCFVIQKRFTDRGFLIGPYCPIYGVCSILVITLLQKYSKDFLAAFILSALICSIIEYVTSFLMEKLFKARWWDYSNKKLNINGRVCLKNSVLFGVLGMLLICIINPHIEVLFNKFYGNIIYNLISIILACVFITDNIVSLNIISKLKDITYEARKDNTEDITSYVKKVLHSKGILTRRLVNAFPALKIKVKTKAEEFIQGVRERAEKEQENIKKRISNLKSNNIGKRFTLKNMKTRHIAFVVTLMSLSIAVIGVCVMMILTEFNVINETDLDKSMSQYVLILIQCVLGLIALGLPVYIEKKVGVEIPSNMMSVYVVFLYCAIFLGEVQNFYYKLPYWDMLLHTLSGGMLGALGFSVITYMNNSTKIPVNLSPMFVACFALCFAMSLGVVWEIYEFASDGIISTNMQKFALENGELLLGREALSDTMEDLIVDFLGAFFVCTIGYISLKYKKGWVERFQIKFKKKNGK